jgi:creatinine amidohydrolase/Fe(II)-dependent formamide hydrolase-like protein
MTSDDLILKGKMDEWGPFGTNEGKFLIFSIGNPEEGHGFALPRTADDLYSQAVALRISLKSGSRYVAHIPWATDGAMELARDWAPHYIPVEELVERIIPFIASHQKNYAEMGLAHTRVLIYSGHGGNNPLIAFQNKIKEELHLEELIISSTDILANHIGEVVSELQKLATKLSKSNEKSVEDNVKLLSAILLSAGHAGHAEHSMCAAIDIVDFKKLDEMNKELSEDFEGTLAKYPPVGGLGGYLLSGGKYTEAFGTPKNDKHGLWKCLESLRTLNNGKIVVVRELGELLLDLVSTFFAEVILGKRKL